MHRRNTHASRIFAHSCDHGCSECMQGTEILAMHRHGELLGGNEEERRRRERAAREHATALDAEDGMAARRDRSVGKLLAPGPAGGLSGPYSIYLTLGISIQNRVPSLVLANCMKSSAAFFISPTCVLIDGTVCRSPSQTSEMHLQVAELHKSPLSA